MAYVAANPVAIPISLSFACHTTPHCLAVQVGTMAVPAPVDQLRLQMRYPSEQARALILIGYGCRWSSSEGCLLNYNDDSHDYPERQCIPRQVY
jgi:hypothetical protein